MTEPTSICFSGASQIIGLKQTSLGIFRVLLDFHIFQGCLFNKAGSMAVQVLPVYHGATLSAHTKLVSLHR